MRTCRAWYHARHFFIESYVWKGAILYTSEKIFTIGFEKHSKKRKKHSRDGRKREFSSALIYNGIIFILQIYKCSPCQYFKNDIQ